MVVIFVQGVKIWKKNIKIDMIKRMKSSMNF